MVDEGLLETLEVGQHRESFDRQHLSAVDVRGEGATSADRRAVDEHRAGPAHLRVTRPLRSREAAILTEIVEQEKLRLDVGSHQLAVQTDLDLHGAGETSSPTRPSF